MNCLNSILDENLNIVRHFKFVFFYHRRLENVYVGKSIQYSSHYGFTFSLLMYLTDLIWCKDLLFYDAVTSRARKVCFLV